MKPPPDDDPTAEEEIPEFDGTSTDQLGDRYRVVVAAASEAVPDARAPKPVGGGDVHDALPAQKIERD